MGKAKQETGFNRRKLWLLFLLAAAVRAFLAVITRDGPVVVIDEGLYTNIARSLAFEGKVLFRGQPVNYPYLVYPLLLTPLYRLNALLGGPVYRGCRSSTACSLVRPSSPPSRSGRNSRAAKERASQRRFLPRSCPTG